MRLRRGSLLQTEHIPSMKGSLHLLPRVPTKRSKARMTVCDEAGIIRFFSVELQRDDDDDDDEVNATPNDAKKRRKKKVAIPASTSGGVSCVSTLHYETEAATAEGGGIQAGALHQDQTFVVRGSVVEAFTRKGVAFFRVDTHTTEPLHELYVCTPFFFTAGNYMLTAFREGSEMGVYMSPNRVISMAVFTPAIPPALLNPSIEGSVSPPQPLAMPDFHVCLGCSDRVIRVVSGLTLLQEVVVADGGEPTALLMDDTHRLLFCGTHHGSVIAYRVAPFEVAALTVCDSYSTGDGGSAAAVIGLSVLDCDVPTLAISRADGLLEVVVMIGAVVAADADEQRDGEGSLLEFQLLASLQLGEPAMSVTGGLLGGGSSGTTPLTCCLAHLQSGRVVSLLVEAAPAEEPEDEDALQLRLLEVPTVPIVAVVEPNPPKLDEPKKVKRVAPPPPPPPPLAAADKSLVTQLEEGEAEVESLQRAVDAKIIQLQNHEAAQQQQQQQQVQQQQQQQQQQRQQQQQQQVQKQQQRHAAMAAAAAATAVGPTFHAKIQLFPVEERLGNPQLRVVIDASAPVSCAIVRCPHLHIPLESTPTTHVSKACQVAPLSQWCSSGQFGSAAGGGGGGASSRGMIGSTAIAVPAEHGGVSVAESINTARRLELMIRLVAFDAASQRMVTIRRPAELRVTVFGGLHPLTTQEHLVFLVALPFFRRLPEWTAPGPVNEDTAGANSSSQLLLSINELSTSHIEFSGSLSLEDVWTWLSLLVFEMPHSPDDLKNLYGVAYRDEVNGIDFGIRVIFDDHDDSQQPQTLTVRFSSTALSTLQVIKEVVLTSAVAKVTSLTTVERIHFNTAAHRLEKLRPLIEDTALQLRRRLVWKGLQEITTEDDEGAAILQGGGGASLPPELREVIASFQSSSQVAAEESDSHTTQDYLRTALLCEYEDLVTFKRHTASLLEGGEPLLAALTAAACSPHAKVDSLRLLFFPSQEDDEERTQCNAAGGAVAYDAAALGQDRENNSGSEHRNPSQRHHHQHQRKLRATDQLGAEVDDDDEAEEEPYRIPRGPLILRGVDCLSNDDDDGHCVSVKEAANGVEEDAGSQQQRSSEDIVPAAHQEVSDTDNQHENVEEGEL